MPPATRLRPSTRSKFPMMLPESDALTTLMCPARKAKNAMIISVALPMVALRIPPMDGPQYAASTLVDSPSTLANGAMARAEAMKITSGGACRRSSAMAAGTNSRSRFSQRCPVLSGNLLHSVDCGEGFGIRQIVKDGDWAYRSGAGRARAPAVHWGSESFIRMRQHGGKQAL